MANESSVLKVVAGTTTKKVTGTISLVNESGVALFQSSKFNLGGDMFIYWGAGAPVDYTDGDPAATGQAEAGIGSLYINVTNGKHYVNKGTKAQPVWGIITSA